MSTATAGAASTADTAGPTAAATQRLVSEWLVWLASGSASEPTIGVRRYWLTRWLQHLGRRSVWSVETADVARWLTEGGWAVETRRSARAAVTSFYTWARRTRTAPARSAVGREHPCEGLPAMRVGRVVAHPAPDAVIVAALARADERSRAALCLGAMAGLRRGEIARLRLGDVEAQPASLVIHGKGGHLRRVPIGWTLHEQLVRVAEGCEYVVHSLVDGGPLTVNHVGVLVSRALPPGWSSHDLRHRYATAAYEAERDLMAVSELLGHAKVETTRRYVALPRAAITRAAAAAELDIPAMDGAA